MMRFDSLLWQTFSCAILDISPLTALLHYLGSIVGSYIVCCCIYGKSRLVCGRMICSVTAPFNNFRCRPQMLPCCYFNFDPASVQVVVHVWLFSFGELSLAPLLPSGRTSVTPPPPFFRPSSRLGLLSLPTSTAAHSYSFCCCTAPVPTQTGTLSALLSEETSPLTHQRSLPRYLRLRVVLL